MTTLYDLEKYKELISQKYPDIKVELLKYNKELALVLEKAYLYISIDGKLFTIQIMDIKTKGFKIQPTYDLFDSLDRLMKKYNK